MKKIFIITGEPSGDKLASEIISKLKLQNSNIEYLSVGGEHLNNLGIKSIYDLKDITYLGFTSVLFNIFDIKKSSLIPKPNKESLESLINFYNLNPRETVYFEDIEINLKNAYDFGITTFLIDHNKRALKKSYVNYSFNTLISALDFLKRE